MNDQVKVCMTTISNDNMKHNSASGATTKRSLENGQLFQRPGSLSQVRSSYQYVQHNANQPFSYLNPATSGGSSSNYYPQHIEVFDTDDHNGGMNQDEEFDEELDDMIDSHNFQHSLPQETSKSKYRDESPEPGETQQTKRSLVNDESEPHRA